MLAGNSWWAKVATRRISAHFGQVEAVEVFGAGDEAGWCGPCRSATATPSRNIGLMVLA